MRIQVLDVETSNRIAAGEVVDRPASVIKELCENALDAGASAITVEIENGGLSLLRVVDNGCGIEAQDVSLAFERHATSKIQSGDSLSGIETLGFRGEALSSIAAVSQVVMTTRTRSGKTGTRIEIVGGRVLSDMPCGCPEGTAIDVRNLFFNTPARLKFTKSPVAETAQISDILLRIMLANPDVAIRFLNQKKVVMQTPGTGLADTMLAIYGASVTEQCIPVTKGEELDLYGYVGKPEVARLTHAAQTLILNGRFIRNTALADAVAQGYDERLMTGKFPLFVLHLRMPFAVVDVNVHPQKLQVRFTDEQSLAKLVTGRVKDAWRKYQQTPVLFPPVPSERPGNDAIAYSDTNRIAAASQPFSETVPVQSKIFIDSYFSSDSISVLKEPTGIDFPISVNDKSEPEHEQMHWKAEYRAIGTSKTIGQLFETYLLVESQESLLIIDQHAAHERLQYDAISAALERGAIASQALLQPVFVDLTYREMAVYKQMEQAFGLLGFEIEQFGEQSVVVRSVPMLMEQRAVRDLLRDALDLAELGQLAGSLSLQRERILRFACRHSVKAGDTLSTSEIEAIVNRLTENEHLTCPHGRPVAIRVKLSDLEKGFGRIV